jgi:actin-related protein 8
LIDLELLTREAIRDLDIMPGTNFHDYTVILCVPDLFHRAQYKRVIDMLIKNIGFGRFFIHLQSVMAAYGGALNPCCVVNIGHTSTTVSALEDGVVIPESMIYK